MIAIILTKVVIFIPPAVPEGAPPILISKISSNSEHEDNVPIFTVLNPTVVIAATDWKNDSISDNPGEVTNKVNVPKANIAAVAKVIILVVREMESVLRRIKLNTSVTTINPIDPAKAKHETTILIVLLSAKFSKLLFHSENPAVQNAEILWNMLYHSALSTVKSW